MITAKVTNIVLEVDKFRVTVQYSNGATDNILYNGEATLNEMKDAIVNRIVYFNQLSAKEQELQQYLNVEIKA